MELSSLNIKKYREEGIDGLVKAVKADSFISSLLKGGISSEGIKNFVLIQMLTNEELDSRFKTVSIDMALNAVVERLLAENQPEQPEPPKKHDAVHDAVDYFRESKYYKAWLETDTGTEGGLTGAVLIAYALDGKFNELCRKAGLNCSSAVARVIVTRLLEQKHE